MNMNRFKSPEQPSVAPADNGLKQGHRISGFQFGEKPQAPHAPSSQHPDLSWGELNEPPSLSEKASADKGEGFIDFSEPPSLLGEVGSEAPVTDGHTPTIPPRAR